MHIICFFHTATIIFYLPILGNQNLHPAYFIFRLEHFSYSTNFPPTCLLLDGFRLGQFFPFRQFFPNLLASLMLPVGAFLPIPPIFPQPARKQACSDACAWLVAPDNPAGFRLHITGTSSPLRSDSVSVIPQIHAFARKQACSDACAWGIITQKSPRAMWSSAGLLEKGVDYKFHVREFMFRCG